MHIAGTSFYTISVMQSVNIVLNIKAIDLQKIKS